MSDARITARGRPQKYDEPLVRKEVLLLESQARAVEAYARETSGGSFSEALREIVGQWVERKGGK